MTNTNKVLKIELELAQKLNDLFTTDRALYADASELAKLAIKELIRLAKSKEQIVDKLIRLEENLTVLKEYNVRTHRDLNALLKASLTIIEIGEIVRLYAGIFEEIYKRSDDESNFVYRNWGAAFDKKNRARTTNSIKNIGAIKDSTTKEIVKNHFKALIKKERIHSLSYTQLDEHVSGVSRFTLKSNSTIKKICKAFSLPEGADISGTTTDTIWAIERLANLNKKVSTWNKNLLLLPIASIVCAYHHTLLETAMALQMNEYIKCYTPKYYSSLKIYGYDKIDRRIINILAAAEGKIISNQLLSAKGKQYGTDKGKFQQDQQLTKERYFKF